MTDDQWAKLSDFQKDRKVRETVFAGTYLDELHKYTTTGNGMMLVIDAMREKGWNRIAVEYVYDRWWARFRKLDDAGRELGYGDGRADTAPSAIALAAYRALEATK